MTQESKYEHPQRLINHPNNMALVVLREHYVSICENAPDPRCAAVLLNQIDHWTGNTLQDGANWVFRSKMQLKEAEHDNNAEAIRESKKRDTQNPDVPKVKPAIMVKNPNQGEYSLDMIKGGPKPSSLTGTHRDWVVALLLAMGQGDLLTHEASLHDKSLGRYHALAKVLREKCETYLVGKTDIMISPHILFEYWGENGWKGGWVFQNALPSNSKAGLNAFEKYFDEYLSDKHAAHNRRSKNTKSFRQEFAKSAEAAERRKKEGYLTEEERKAIWRKNQELKAAIRAKASHNASEGG